jgi:outer membrane protein insertion porin family
MRVSVSSLKCSTQPVRTRFSRIVSVIEASRRLAPRAWFVMACGLLLLTPAISRSASAQVGARPRFTADAAPEVLCQTQVVGNRRIPKESILARLFSRAGDQYDPAVVERDFNSLWNTGYFDNVRIESVPGTGCLQLIIYIQEKPTIRDINYIGNNAITTSDILERYKKDKISFSVESQYDPTVVKRAEVTLQQMEGEHGHQFAVIRLEVKTIPPAGVSLTFHIKEGPTVKVGRISFPGAHALPNRELINAMKNLKPIGIPHSIFLENLFPRTFDASKLDEDAERVRQEYRIKGYFYANTAEPQTNVRNAGGIDPFTLHPSTGKRVDIAIPVEEGERYRLGSITFTGNKAYVNTAALRRFFAMKDGDWFNAELFSKGLDALKKAYGEGGYINMVGTPTPTPPDRIKHIVSFNIDIDEGKKFFVSRLEFSGNTITRDKVIRREMLVEEGQVYNSRLVDLSLLRLNQLQYFDVLKADQDVETRQNPDADPEYGTVDLLVKLKEKGKNSIGLNGGISGNSGTFIGANYETNNFLGLGETLSVTANLGDLARNLAFGFNEPYLHNKPISIGIQVFDTKNDFNPAKAYAIANNQSANLTNAQQSQITQYNQSSKGLTISASEALRNLFRRSGVARMGISYGLSRSGITTFNQNTLNVFTTLAFRSGIAGQNQLQGIITSVITPSFSFSTLDRGQGPHSGKDFNVAFQFAGLGGNTKYYSPNVSYRQYFPMKGLKVNREGHNVLGYRLLFNHIAGFGGQVAPPFARVYGGGESDLRGFDVRSAGPYTFIPTKVNFNLTNPDGSGVPRDPTNPSLGDVQIPLPVYRLSSVGGDTSFTANLEYRIPIVSQVTFAFFTDFGMTFDTQPSQLRQSVLGLSSVNSPLYGCPVLVNGTCQGGQSVQFPLLLPVVSHTNYVPRMSNGAELQVILPIVNAPFRLFYAYNPLRLYQDLPQQLAVSPAEFRSFFPNSGAGLYSYQQALQFYGADYLLREPRKTFRLTISTTF